MTRASLVAVALLFAAACGDDPPDITGLYMTTAHEASASACSGGATPDPSPPYFRIEEREILGAPYHTRTSCQDTDPASCSGGGGILTEETGDGYRGDIYLSSGEPASCTLARSAYDASLDGDQLTWENLNYSESGAFDRCDPDEAEARADEMPCTSYELMVGVRVDD